MEEERRGRECCVKEQRSSSAPEVRMIPTHQKNPLCPKKRRMTSFFVQGNFLQNSEVRKGLEKWKSSGGVAPAMLSKLYRSLRDSPDMLEVCLGLEAPRFPVIWLKHVTTLENFRGILKDGAFYGSNRPFYLKGKVVDLRVSCWSPHIPRPEVESFKNKRFEEFMQRLEDRSSTYQYPCQEEPDVWEMGANSPALRDDSRYGNCLFPFRLEELLWNYKEQQCGGQEPTLRVLGTEAYKLEVVHWVLIHSPSWGGFEHLPLLDSVWPRSQKGNLMWAPESTTNFYTWYIDPSTGRLGKYPRKTNLRKMYDPWMWNNVVFAFHLPWGRTLELERNLLLDRVEACETARSLWGDSSRVLRHPPEKYVSKEEAEYIIHEERRRGRGRAGILGNHRHLPAPNSGDT